MGGDMTNVKNSNLKVPPLKIVLSSATSGGSDRSSSTSPSSESESLDSNLTIISENQQQQERQKRDDSTQGKLARQASKSDKTTLNSTTIVPGSRRSHDGVSELTTNNNNEQSTSSNQRITRSSQRAAQQNGTNGDETNVIETQDTNNKSTNESGQRKVKRRKGEVQESEQDKDQQVPQQPLIMANICPADYRLPSQNSFELYRDIRNRPYTKMMKLTSVQPKMPQGFREYLLNSGPYLLDGNKVGVGVGSSRNYPNYKIPNQADTPRHLKTDSPLCELFQDQERARHKMKIQHLKERERSVLSAEQEILRAHNRVAIADTRQASHLSACTYFYYQDRYHYIDEKSNYLDSINAKDSSQSRENSDSCNAENNAADRLQSDDVAEPNGKEVKVAEPNGNEAKMDESSPDDGLGPVQSRVINSDSCNGENSVADRPQNDDVAEPKGKKVKMERHSQSDADNNTTSDSKMSATTEDNSAEKQQQQQQDGDSDNKNVSEPKDEVISDADLKELNKTNLISSLHEIDEKWAKIREEMFVRHKNESDSLYAVQCLEWEWKAKEIGACDIRLSPRIESESVPRVDVSPLDY